MSVLSLVASTLGNPRHRFTNIRAGRGRRHNGRSSAMG
jgi:hypothetical protein